MRSLRIRPRAQVARDPSPIPSRLDAQLPNIAQDDSFRQVIRKLSRYLVEVIELPSTFEQLRTTTAGNCLRDLVDHLAHTCTNPSIISALLALKWHYASDQEQQGLGPSRSDACEIVAWRLLTRFSEREVLDYCLFEIPRAKAGYPTTTVESAATPADAEAGEATPLLLHAQVSDIDTSRPSVSAMKRTEMLDSLSRLAEGTEDEDASPDEYPASFAGLNALEVAAAASAKSFLSQHVVQKIITGIWNGNIVFWDSLSAGSTKEPRFYKLAVSDLYSRLRVPKYMKCWEVIFFAIFLSLFYAVLIARVIPHMTAAEVFLYVWFSAFVYDEFSEWLDAGSIFYAADIWNFFDVVMILIGIISIVLRIAGLVQGDPNLSEWAFDVLSLQALFMIPRVCSFLSLSPYWGTLIPCLKEMGKEFIKFMVLVVIVYLGFLTTFSLVGRDVYSLSKMTMTLTRIFFGSSYVGFDVMHEIDPIFGPPLMIIFVMLTNILLLGSMTGMLANSFSRVTMHAREEYLYMYSVYVLEASTSNRLTRFYPPFNLLAFIIFRPLRLMAVPSRHIRVGRLMLLKVTHLPIVAGIKIYELLRRKIFEEDFVKFMDHKEPKGRIGNPDIPSPSLSAGHGSKTPEPEHEGPLEYGEASSDGSAQGGHTQLGEQITELTKRFDTLVETEHVSDLTKKMDSLMQMMLDIKEQQEWLKQATMAGSGSGSGRRDRKASEAVPMDLATRFLEPS